MKPKEGKMWKRRRKYGERDRGRETGGVTKSRSTGE
jgi:hypothetical protein